MIRLFFYKYIFMILTIFLLSSCLFSFAVLDDFEDTETYRILTYKITADDEESIILKQYDEIEPFWIVIGGGRALYVRLFSERDSKLIGEFWFGDYLLKEHEGDYVLSIKKIEDYQNVTLYEFSLTYTYDKLYNIPPIISQDFSIQFPPAVGDRVTYRLKLWIDKNTGEFSGSITSIPIDLNTSSFEGYEYYTGIQDVLVDLAHEEFDNFNRDFEQNDPHEVDPYFQIIIRWITNFDIDLANELQKQLDALERKSAEIRLNIHLREVTKDFLNTYTSPVSALQEKLAEHKKHIEQFIVEMPEYVAEEHLRLVNALERPEVAGEFPIDEQELKAYEAWAQLIFLSGYFGVPLDGYGTPIKFEFVDGGLKATSAGADKEFGTDDDMVYINGVEQTKN